MSSTNPLVLAADAMHGALLLEVEQLIDSGPDATSENGRKLRRLADIVESYEKLRWPIKASD